MSRMIDDEETLKDNGLIEIDGCNVAECSLYNNGKCLNFWNSETKEYDKCNSYCDYGAYARQEQLQRAKAENERLKEMTGVYSVRLMEKYKQALEDIKNNCVEILATIEEEGKPNHSIVDTIWCKNIPCCTLWELVEGMQREINEVLNERI